MSSDQLSPLVADLHLLTVLAAHPQLYRDGAPPGRASKASVSMRISELERAAGVMLVRRTTRSVGLTEAGQQLVNGMQPAFNRISESYTAVKDLVGTPRGLVRVTAPVALGRQHLAPCVAAFLKRFPDIHIELELTDRFVNLANEGFDLAIRHTNAPPETHVAWVLCETRSILLASPDYLARRGVPSQPSELSAPRLSALPGQPQCRHLDVCAHRQAQVARAGGRERLPARSRPTTAKCCARPWWPAWASACCRTSASPPGGPANSHRRHSCTCCPTGRCKGFFGERIYALRPWSAQVPKAVQYALSSI
jgi:DNA-binding transcriptional LysR family regulator